MEQKIKKHLLLVDDNKQFSELVQGVFGEEFEVAWADDGPAGLQKCAELLPDVVLLDVNMPGMNGIEFLRRMSMEKAIAHIPVIVITASDFNGITESLAQRYVNVSAFITKLSPSDTIREKILKALAG